MTREAAVDGRIGSIRIGPDDPRYLAVVDKRFNKRYRASPDYFRLVSSTDQVVSAVEEGVRDGRRLAVTSGGHCLEGFVSDAEVRVIIDVSPMKRVYYDVVRGAVAVEAGATVGETFRALFETWGVVIPLGEYPEIGMGGHVVGGAFGFLCRQLGLAADYLYAVEVVTVDGGGRASSVVATRETADPHRDLWWAHTGGGGGNFGVVTRYWFRSPGASGDDPVRLLPRAPESITTFKAEWNGCSTVSPPPPQQKESVARVLEAYAKAMKTGDYSSVHFASDVTFLGPLTNGPITGEVQVKAFLLKVSAGVKDVRVKRQVIDCEFACVIADLETKEGNVVPFCEFFRIVDGRIAEIRPYFDPRPLIR